jgi:ElaB/YqjD/DUF883 family membrane-anchored ribosome-binding protein
MPRQRSSAAGEAQSAKSGSTSAPDSARDQRQGGGVMDEAKDKVQELASRAQDKASDQAESGMSKGKSRAADTLGAVAQSLLVSSQQLRDQDRRTVGGIVEKAANRVEHWADYVQNTDAREMAQRVESYARREPAIFLGSAFALGLLGARFLKSSRKGEQPYRSPYQSQAMASDQRSSRPRGMLSDREVPISRTPY